MSEIATPGQLRMSFARWALVTVPAIVFIDDLTGMQTLRGNSSRWFR